MLGLLLSQKQYISMILTRFGMQDAKPANTPIAPGLKLKWLEKATVNKSLYQLMLGSAMYAMVGTCPDIVFAICMLSQHSATPGTEHLAALK
jgi:hypothetical protein